MQRNPKALAIASRRALAKTRKIKELGITPDMDVKAQDALVLALSEKKVCEGKTLEDFTKGQEWYVQDLMAFSALSPEERFELEYRDAFDETSSASEIIAAVAAAM